jgi:hypothetical protein
MKDLINRDDPVYILFGWEAKEARPNCDPFTGSLRIHTDTYQVWTTGVHLKHHIRRVLEVPGETYMKGKAHFATFYIKYDDEGNPVSFNKRLDRIAEVFGFNKYDDGRAAVDYCLDLPLFGFVNAYKNPKARKAKDTQKSEAEVGTFNLCNAANTLFDPVTFHSCEIKYIGTNNAFPSEDASGQVNTSAGSSTRDRLEYGLFLGLIEVNLPTLASNTRHHKFLPWSDGDNAAKWIDVLASAQWAAYTTHRFSSQTQRNQFAKLQVIWQPKQAEISEYVYPKDLIDLLGKNKLVTSWPGAKKALNTVLPYLLESYKLTKDNLLGDTLAEGIVLPV